MSGLTSRTKGAVAEREVIQMLRRYWPNAERSSKGRAQAGVSDVLHGPEGMAIEIKRQEKLSVPSAFDQLSRDAGHLTPVLVHRPSRHKWMATVELDELLSLLALRERA